MRLRRRILRSIIVILLMTLAFLMGIYLTVTYLYDAIRNNTTLASSQVYEAIPGPDIPTIQAIIGAATTDAEALDAISAYYQTNRARLADLWHEDNPTRLAGLFTMYLVHISHIYGESDYPTTLLDFVGQARAHCGTYTLAEADIAHKLGLTWRAWELSSGWHGWLEIYVDDHWELFDSTVNVWISRPALELVQGVDRAYREFYSPLTDASRPDARIHLSEGYNMLDLRAKMPGLGLYFFPPGEIQPYQRASEFVGT